MSFAETVETWFGNELGGSLLLPDGWYGRPFDNQHSLTAVHEQDGTLIVILDKDLRLRFEGLRTVRVENNELIFGPFKKLHFDWHLIGSLKRGTKEYSTGEVRIISHPG